MPGVWVVHCDECGRLIEDGKELTARIEPGINVRYAMNDVPAPTLCLYACDLTCLRQAAHTAIKRRWKCPPLS